MVVAVRFAEFEEHIHRDGVRKCFVELQDAESMLDPRMPRGAAIATEYLSGMHDRCNTCRGKVLVALVDAEVVGYATIMTKVTSEELGDADIEYGLISDLVISEEFRRKGLGRRLLEAAETYARSHGVKWLRIGSLAMNKSARTLYESSGFTNLYVELEKDLRE